MIAFKLTLNNYFIVSNIHCLFFTHLTINSKHQDLFCNALSN